MLSDWMKKKQKGGFLVQSPDRQSVCGVEVRPPHQRHAGRQSRTLAHLHLDTEGTELRGQRLQELLRGPRTYRY